MKIRTKEELFSNLEDEVAWRNKEISEYNLLVKSSAGSTQKSLIRGGVAISYAHLEGFIKLSSEMYLAYVESRRLKYSDLTDIMIVFAAKKYLRAINDSTSHENNTTALRKLLDSMDDRASFSLQNSIDTESNLKSKVFKNIAYSIGISCEKYEEYYEFIDDTLLKNRNKIAHGEFVAISPAKFDELIRIVLSIIRAYKTDIENAVITEIYKKA